MPFTFEQIFLAALLFYFLVHVFTCTAEIVHLKRTISEVPAVLREKISLAQHTKAARYDIARTKLNLLEVTVTTCVILALTLFQGIDDISEFLIDQVGDQFAFHWMLPALIGFIFLIVDLPFSWYKEFRLREAYGYMREQPSRWFGRFALMSILGWLAALPILWIVLWLWRQSGSLWWIAGWVVFSAYLIFPLQLACRLRYSLRPSMAEKCNNEPLIDRLKKLGTRAGIQIDDIRVANPEHNDQLPPAFAFGHRKKVRLFIRHDVYNKLSEDNLMAISAHALARNLSHMYFQAWAVCALVSLLVFMFLGWLAPQSWFLNEIGFKAIGPGPYYGSLLAFAIVALPVILFPFKLPMEAFLRHLIFRSDLFALHYAGLNSITNALIELTPSPIRHSCVTLEFFDLLFSHEPSLMARINRVQKDYMKIKNELLEQQKFEADLARNRNIVNVSLALDQHNKHKSLVDYDRQENLQRELAHKKEAELIAKAEAQRNNVTQPLGSYIDPAQEINEKAFSQDNTQHRTYKMSIWQGFVDIIQRLDKMQKDYRAQRKAKALAQQSDVSEVSAPVAEIKESEVVKTDDIVHSDSHISGSHTVDTVVDEPIVTKSEDKVEEVLKADNIEKISPSIDSTAKTVKEVEVAEKFEHDLNEKTIVNEDTQVDIPVESESNVVSEEIKPEKESVSEKADSLAIESESQKTNDAEVTDTPLTETSEAIEQTVETQPSQEPVVSEKVETKVLEIDEEKSEVQTVSTEKVSETKAAFKRPSSSRRKVALKQLRQRHSAFEETKHETVEETK